MFGFDYYEDQQFKAQAKASAKAEFEKKKNAPPPEPGYFDKPAPGTAPTWGNGMEYEPLDGNFGYLIGSGVRAFEDIGKAGAMLLGEYEAVAEPGKIKIDAEHTLAATRVVGDIARTMLPFFIPGAGVAVGSTTMAATTGIESVEQGMDAGTAGTRTALAGATALGMAAVAPLSGKALNALFSGQGNAVAEVGKSFALNMGLGQAQRTADWAVVKQKYPELAEQLEVFGPTTVGLDIAMWGLFAGMGYRQVRQQLVKSGVPLTDATRAIRTAEEIIGADTAVNDAVYVRRQGKTLEDGPLLSPEAYDVQLAMVDDVMARLDNAEPLPVDLPDNVALKPVEPVPVQDTTGRVLLGGREGTRPALPREEVTKFVTDFGLDQNRVVIHDTTNPLPDFILKAAEREGGTATTTEAWLGRDGTLHINLDAFDSIERMKDVVGFHEITHRGQDVELLAEVQKVLPADQFLRSQIERMATERGYDLATKEGSEKALKEATAEAMLDAVYRGKVADAMNQGWFSTVVNKVKQVLRDLGVKIEYSDEDAARLVGTMWQRGKERLSAAPETNQWRTVYDALQDAKGIFRGARKGKNYTDSDFQNHLKEFYPSVYDGAYSKDEVLAAVKNLATNSSRRLTDRQREIISNFEYDLGRVESQMVDVPFSIAPKTDTPEFKAWFGDSKVVDEQGKPLVVYRGTTGDMPEIDAGVSANFGEIFFTDSKKLASVYANKYNNGVVVPVYLKIENASDGKILGSGIAIAPNAKIFTVNDIRNVKSATGNRGTFDPADPRIDFSIAHAAPYLRELDAALERRGAAGEHAIVDVPMVGKRQIITEIKRSGKVIGYMERWLDRNNTMTRAKVDSALKSGNMGVLSEVYQMEDRFSQQYGLDLTGAYISDVTRGLAKKGGALPMEEGSGILTLKNGREEGKAYNPTPEEMRAMQQARDNDAVRSRYEQFIESRIAEKLAAAQRRVDAINATAAGQGAGRGTDAGSPASGDTVGRTASEADLTPTQQLDAAMSGLKSLEADDVDFSIQPPLPNTDGTTGRTKAADEYLARLVKLTENQITPDEAAQIVGTVEDRYAYLGRRLQQPQADLLTEFRRMGVDAFIKAKPDEFMGMTEAERRSELMRAELLKTLSDKKEAIRRQKIVAEKLQATMQTLQGMQTSRNMTERWIDLLMGDPSGKGQGQPWINKALGIQHEYLARMAGGIKEFDGWLGLKMDQAQELALAQEMHRPGSSGDAAMKRAAESIRATFDAMRNRANKAGADIGYIEGYFPQGWNSRQVMLFGLDAAGILKGATDQRAAIAKSRAAWVDFMLQRVDRNHPAYIDEATGAFYSDDQMKAFLGKAFDTLSSNGAAKGIATQQKGGLANRMASERQLHFKDAEGWIEANKLFGSQDLLTSIMGHVQRTSRDIALLEMFGPSPDRIHREVMAKAVQADASGQWLYNRKVNFAEALWTEVTGSRGTAGTGMVADSLAAARQSMVFSRLGSALLSQLGDLPIFHAMAVKSGMPEFASMLEITRTLNPAKVGDRRIADTFEFGLSALHDDVMSRIMDTTNGKGLSAKAAQFTMQAGGMKWWADRMDHAAKLLLARGLYHMRGTAWADLSAGNAALLQRSGINEADWNNIRTSESLVADFNGREVLAPHLIEDATLREKVWGMLEREATFMALRPDEKTRALIKGSSQRGSLEGELRNSMFLFRSFTAAMIQKVYPRLTARLPGESRGQWMYTAGTFMLASTLMAAMSTQLKEIDKGRMPRDMDDPRFWAQSFGQAWNLGVIGDLLYGDRNRFGQTATATIAGPVVGMLEDVGGLTVGNMKDAAAGEKVDLAADTVRAVKNYATPNLWYLRPALDQFLWWPLQEMSNPGYLQRSQNRIERENNTKFWLPPTGAERY